LSRIGITGHQTVPRAALPFVRASISEALNERHPTVVGITSLAAGADQIFARLVLESGGTLHAIIPCERYEDAFTTSESLQEFRRLLAKTDYCEILPYASPTEEAFLHAGKRVVDASELLIAVWDGEPAKGVGGTADIVEYARAKSRNVVIVWPKNVRR
jgi:hypothetical protein